MKRLTLSTAFFVLAVAIAGVAHAAPAKKTLCVYDPSGANGDLFNAMESYKIEALSWGVEFTLKPYTDEKTAAEDFKAGQCHASLITGTRGRPFHKFGGTLEAMGGLPSYAHLTRIVKTLSKPKAKKLMTSGKYEVAGIWPGGAVYLFVRDRTVDTVRELAGKRIATMSFDAAAKTMVRKIGASLVAADVGTFAGMYNNGSVDACYSPALGYKALELYKGIGTKGGVIRYPLAQMTLQLLMRTADFPDGFGEKSRAYAGKSFKDALKMVKLAEKAIPKEHWIDIPAADMERYDEMFLDVRIELRDEQKVYNKTALKLLRKLRCKMDGARGECVQKRE